MREDDTKLLSFAHFINGRDQFQFHSTGLGPDGRCVCRGLRHSALVAVIFIVDGGQGSSHLQFPDFDPSQAVCTVYLARICENITIKPNCTKWSVPARKRCPQLDLGGSRGRRRFDPYYL